MSSQGDDFREAKDYGIKTALMPWGKHKGKLIIELPFSYLDWLRCSEHFDHLSYDEKNAVKSRV